MPVYTGGFSEEEKIQNQNSTTRYKFNTSDTRSKVG